MTTPQTQTPCEPAQRLTGLQRIAITMAGGLVVWGTAYAVFTANADLGQQLDVIRAITGNYGIVVLEAALGWTFLLAVVPRAWRFLVPVGIAVALPTLLTLMFGLGMGVIYLYEHRAAAAVACVVFWLLLGWQVFSWGGKKKDPRKKR